MRLAQHKLLPWMVALRSINGLELSALKSCAVLGRFRTQKGLFTSFYYRCGGSVGVSPTSQFNHQYYWRNLSSAASIGKRLQMSMH